ncbi:uncharacterized protein MELLADRAFT_60810 [Melampsora larici-populina 98AG31]|uniref:F-box domain-containing protein n=1 Tax=Melampsora larici-populina (strain 98AG31 / pathotype 3-4-7) TaxID=747676 RepID=F4RCF4_MELLP|nr:uncharacterized protein MELLADRAFT_60810 [Melampsora larici-populina 98AG31]EGG09972.1 hypothetical protein MELLADRAFT_60810 [Melampsora larici-populina 98AG31]
MSLYTFSGLPIEIIERIVIILAALDPYKPPKTILSLLLLNRRFSSILRPDLNPSLYATIFRYRFDAEALERRFNTTESDEVFHKRQKRVITASSPVGVPGSDQQCSSSSSSQLGDGQSQSPHSSSFATQLSETYFDRLNLFNRLRFYASLPLCQEPNPDSPYYHNDGISMTNCQAESSQPKMRLLTKDLWMIYLMVMENDGKNWIQLLKAANIVQFLKNYHHNELITLAVTPGYPPESPETAIGMRLYHLFVELQEEGPDSSPEYEEMRETNFFVLKPYVFGCHVFEVAYAPWSWRQLPASPSSTSSSSPTQSLGDVTDHPNALSNTSTSTSLPVLPLDIPDSQPSTEISASVSTSEENLTQDEHTNSPTTPCQHNGPSNKVTYSTFRYMGQTIRILPPLSSHVAMMSFFWGVSCLNELDRRSGRFMLNSHNSWSEISNGNTTNFNIPSNSINHQSTSIHPDDLFSMKMKRILECDSNSYDLEYHRTTRCLNPYSSPGLQFDTFKNCFNGIWEGKFMFFDYTSYREMLMGRLQSVFEGRYGDQPQVLKMREVIVRLSDGKRVEFKNQRQSNHLLNLDSNDQIRGGENEDETEYLLKMPFREDDEKIEEIEYDSNERYELQIHGTGHSAWGKCKLKGRVRAWDGMLTLLKNYKLDEDPVSLNDHQVNGEILRNTCWLYRGYSTPEGALIGRWRDTYTPQNIPGYEGTFVMLPR